MHEPEVCVSRKQVSTAKLSSSIHIKKQPFMKEKKKSPLTLYSSALTFYFITGLFFHAFQIQLRLAYLILCENSFWTSPQPQAHPVVLDSQKKCTWISHLESFLREREVLKYTSDLLMKITPKKHKSLAEVEPPDTPKEYLNSFGSGRDVFSLQNSVPRTSSPN